MKTTIQDTQTQLRDGTRVPDHRASAKANLDKASEAVGTSVTGAIGATVDASHAAVHGVLGALQGKSE